MKKPCPMCLGIGEIVVPIGDRIRALRKATKLTQEQVAEKVGISRTSLANIEADRQGMSTDQIVAVARFFQVSTDHLLGLDENA